jgi:hypothetical protein
VLRSSLTQSSKQRTKKKPKKKKKESSLRQSLTKNQGFWQKKLVSTPLNNHEFFLTGSLVLTRQAL